MPYYPWMTHYVVAQNLIFCVLVKATCSPLLHVLILHIFCFPIFFKWTYSPLDMTID